MPGRRRGHGAGLGRRVAAGRRAGGALAPCRTIATLGGARSGPRARAGARAGREVSASAMGPPPQRGPSGGAGGRGGRAGRRASEAGSPVGAGCALRSLAERRAHVGGQRPRARRGCAPMRVSRLSRRAEPEARPGDAEIGAARRRGLVSPRKGRRLTRVYGRNPCRPRRSRRPDRAAPRRGSRARRPRPAPGRGPGPHRDCRRPHPGRARPHPRTGGGRGSLRDPRPRSRARPPQSASGPRSRRRAGRYPVARSAPPGRPATRLRAAPGPLEERGLAGSTSRRGNPCGGPQAEGFVKSPGTGDALPAEHETPEAGSAGAPRLAAAPTSGARTQG